MQHKAQSLFTHWWTAYRGTTGPHWMGCVDRPTAPLFRSISHHSAGSLDCQAFKWKISVGNFEGGYVTFRGVDKYSVTCGCVTTKREEVVWDVWLTKNTSHVLSANSSKQWFLSTRLPPTQGLCYSSDSQCVVSGLSKLSLSCRITVTQFCRFWQSSYFESISF